MTDLLVIANGRHQHGRRGRHWNAMLRRLREIFGNGVDLYFTSGPGDGTRRARAALREGVGWLAAAGGDGTINEVVNGYFEKDRNIQPKSPLTFLPYGSGNDWLRTLGIPLNAEDAVEALARSSIRSVDVGLARFRNLQGQPAHRVFINVAEAGVGARVVTMLDRRRGMRSRIPYRIAALLGALTYRPRRLQLIYDGKTAIATPPVLSLIVASGRYFGAGMHCAPMARPDDGRLDVITLGDFSSLELLGKMGRFVRGTYLTDPKVQHRPAQSIEALSGDRVFLELDGELVGMLPASINALPQALQVRY
jgi:YegS/Rv2252/BmrU family lipid kinase